MAGSTSAAGDMGIFCSGAGAATTPFLPTTIACTVTTYTAERIRTAGASLTAGTPTTATLVLISFPFIVTGTQFPWLYNRTLNVGKTTKMYAIAAAGAAITIGTTAYTIDTTSNIYYTTWACEAGFRSFFSEGASTSFLSGLLALSFF